MRMRRCSGLSTNISPPSDHHAWPPRHASGSWSSRITRRPASASSAVATSPASPPPTTIDVSLHPGGCSTRRISASAARPTSSWRSSGSRVPSRRWISKPGRRSALAVRVSLLRSHHANTSTAAAVEAIVTAPAASGPGRSTRAAQQHRAGEVGGEQRRHEVRAAAVVLLGGLRRVGLVGRLVGGDRLVLDAVVLGQLAAAQGERGGHEREHRRGGLAGRAAQAAAQRACRRARRRRRRRSRPGSRTGAWRRAACA